MSKKKPLPFNSTVWLLRFAADIAQHVINCPVGEIRSKNVKFKGKRITYSDYFKYLLGAIESAASMSDIFLAQAMQKDPNKLTVFPWILPDKDQLPILLSLCFEQPWPVVPQRKGVKKIQFAGAPGLFEDSPVQKKSSRPGEYPSNLQMTSVQIKELEEEFNVEGQLPPNALRLPVRTVKGSQQVFAHIGSTIERMKNNFFDMVVSYIKGTVDRKVPTKYFKDNVKLYNKFIQGGLEAVRAKNSVLTEGEVKDQFFRQALPKQLNDTFVAGALNGLQTELERSFAELEHCTKSQFQQFVQDVTEFSLYKSMFGNFHYEKRTNVDCNNTSVLTCGFPVLLRGAAVDPTHFPAFNKNVIESVDDVIWLLLDVCMQQSAATFEALRQFIDITSDCKARGVSHPKLEQVGGNLLQKPSTITRVVDTSNEVLARTLANTPKYGGRRVQTDTSKEEWMGLRDESMGYTPKQWEALYTNSRHQFKKELATKEVPFKPKKLQGGDEDQLYLYELMLNEKKFRGGYDSYEDQLEYYEFLESQKPSPRDVSVLENIVKRDTLSPEQVEEALAEYDELRSTARVLTGQPLDSSPLLEPLRRGELRGGEVSLFHSALSDLKQEIRRRSQFF